MLNTKPLALEEDGRSLAGLATASFNGRAQNTAPPAAPFAPSRYGDDHRFSFPHFIAACVFVAGMLALFLPHGVEAQLQKRDVLTVVDVLSATPPPPPPPSSAPQPKQQQVTPDNAPPPLMVAPPPVLQINLTPAPATTTVAPPPPQPAAPAVAPAPGATPAHFPGPPAAPAVENRGDLSSTMITAEPPRYPLESRRKREQGVVVLQITLDTSGAVADISVARSCGYDRLDQAALKAVKRWRWSPTRRGGQDVIVRGWVEIPFELQGA